MTAKLELVLWGTLILTKSADNCTAFQTLQRTLTNFLISCITSGPEEVVMPLRICVEDSKKHSYNLGLKNQQKLLLLLLTAHVMDLNSITISIILMIIRVVIQKEDAQKSKFQSLLAWKLISMVSKSVVTLIPCSKFSTPATNPSPRKTLKLLDLVTQQKTLLCLFLNQQVFH